jgi:phage terminase Nu1 subunit (DNA packaging protein)
MAKAKADEAAIRRVNRVDLARFLGVTVADVDKFVEMGCPYIKRAASKGDAWGFDTAFVSNWICDQARITGRRFLRTR